jgi:hypothetical protein
VILVDREGTDTTSVVVADSSAASITNSDDVNEPLGRGCRAKFPSARLQGFVTNTIRKLSPFTRSPSQSHSSGTPYPITHYVNCEKNSLPYRHFLAAITAEKEPMNFHEAVKDARWKEAMQTEIQALERNDAWSMQHLPPGKKALGCKWVYRIKYKARLVVLGNHQVEGINYTETFAPVAKMVTVRTVLAVAAAKAWELHQMDVHNAFLHGDLHEEIFMKMPPGFSVSQPDMVCKLQKSLYGLKQAPRCWFAKLSAALKAYGFQQSYLDYSLFTLNQEGSQLVVLVYVDDLIIAGNTPSVIKRFKLYLSTSFHMKDLGVLKYFLGIEVARNPTGIFLCQRKYALDIISEADLLGAKPAATPLEQNHSLSLADGQLLSNPEQYRRLVG